MTMAQDETGVTAVELAKALGVSSGTVRNAAKKGAGDKVDLTCLSALQVGAICASLNVEVPASLFSEKGAAAGDVEAARGGVEAVLKADAVVEKKAAIEGVEGVLLQRCPNPLFWRVKVDGRVVVLKETRQQVATRLRQGQKVTLWPLPGTEQFTLKNPEVAA